ncbi:hypothetical protein BDL97_13G104600 [Sphagnum fallax]|nr:hypothetical protein BDL97_13G104600 [Sphagnum fallax]
MPLANEDVEQAGYRTLLEKSVMPTFKGWQVQRTPSSTRQARSSVRQEQVGGLRICCYSCRPFRRECVFGPLLRRRSRSKG